MRGPSDSEVGTPETNKIRQLSKVGRAIFKSRSAERYVGRGGEKHPRPWCDQGRNLSPQTNIISDLFANVEVGEDWQGKALDGRTMGAIETNAVCEGRPTIRTQANDDQNLGSQVI